MAASNLNSIRRQVKNVAYNYSETQVKVREATSNDPWGPSSSLMSEIADLTNNTVAFSEIMTMLWKRLNDKNKNWRHVYKSLVLMDYLIKCGSDRVAQMCKENIFAIETLKSFQHIEDNKDQGHNIRQKAAQIVTLLKDEEKLRSERARAIMARKRFVQNSMGISSDGSTTRARIHSDLYDEARPTSVAEEEMQMQLALALSKEEAERESEARRGDDYRLQMALKESEKDSKTAAATPAQAAGSSSAAQSSSAIDDLLSLGPALSGVPAAPTNNADPWGGMSSTANAVSNDPWGAPAPAATNDPWGGSGGMYPALSKPPAATTTQSDPWNVPTNGFQAPSAASNDPWAPVSGSAPNPTQGLLDAWGDISSTQPSTGQNVTNGMAPIMPTQALSNDSTRTDELKAKRATTKTPENFLGANANLVNLDELLGPKQTTGQTRSSSANPFLSASGGGASAQANPFAAAQRPSPTLNQMRQQNNLALGAEASNMSGDAWSSNLPQPLQPSRAAVPAPTNPFL